MHSTPLEILALGLLAAPSLAQTWTMATPATQPTARRAAGAAFDFTQASALLFGGLQTGNVNLDDTWAYDGATWTQLTPATVPPPRWGHRMVLDSRRARIVMFGGRSPTLTATANDTWEWNGTDWTQVMTANAPSPRAFYSMAFDERRGKVVLFGTQSGSTFAGGDETWEYDGTDWALIPTPTTPPGLETPAMAYDKGRGVVVMFGGWNGQSGTLYNSTWEYDGNEWTQRATPTAPIARYRASCVYDDARGRIVVYGGFGNATALTDTWEYDGNDWTQVANIGPVMSTEGMMAYDVVRQQSYFFGGSGPTGISNETWNYTGTTTAIAAAWGRGCATSAGVPSLQPANAPVFGQTYTLNATNLPASSAFILVAHGYSNTQSALGPLPYNMRILGYNGCFLEIDPDFIVFAPAAGGTATTSLSIPVSASYTGFAVYSQALVGDPAAANGNGGATNPVHARIGQ